MARLLQLVLVVSALAAVSCAPAPVVLKFSDLDPFRQQWTIKYSLTSTADKSVFKEHICTAEKFGAPCNQPTMSPEDKIGDKIRIEIALRNATVISNFKTHKAAKPTMITVRLCYSPASSLDRPWRKANQNIKKDRACPIKLPAVPFVAGTENKNTLTYSFSKKHDLPKAVWFVRVVVSCGAVDCQYDGTRTTPTKAGNYFETTTIQQITPGLRVCIIVLSIAGPAFMIAYMVIDEIRQKRK